jgi:subtilisin family serine protease
MEGRGDMRTHLMMGFAFLALAAVPAIADDDPPSYSPGQICCIIEEGASIDSVNARWGTETLDADEDGELYLLSAEGVEDIEAFVALLNTDPDIDVAELNYITESPEATRQMVIGAVGGTWGDFEDQSMAVRIGLAEAHSISRGAGITVAILDTGIDPDHEVFHDRLSPYALDCVDDDDEPWEEADGLDNDGDGIIDEGFGHGTMVAGLVALVAPDAMIMPLRVLDDEGRGTAYGITKAIIFAASHGANVINMSFGVGTEIPSIHRKLRWAERRGCVAVCGAGNRGIEEPPFYPAADSLAFMVTAVDSTDVKASFADYSSLVCVSAPGVGIRSAYPGGDWSVGSGCSFAAPIVAGEVALLLSHAMTYDRPVLCDAIAQGVIPIDELEGNEPYAGKLGAGRIDLPRALAVSSSTPHAADSRRTLRAWPTLSTGSIRLAFDAIPSASLNPALSIMDASGRVVRLLSAQADAAVTWDGRDQSGLRVPAGRYWVRLSDRSASAASLIILR